MKESDKMKENHSHPFTALGMMGFLLYAIVSLFTGTVFDVRYAFIVLVCMTAFEYVVLRVFEEVKR